MRTVMFTKLFKGVPLEEVARHVAGLGFDGIDLLIRDGHQVVPASPGSIGPAVRLMESAGLSVPMATTDLNDPADPTAYPMLAACREAGIRIARLGYFDYTVVKDVFEMRVPGADADARFGLEGRAAG